MNQEKPTISQNAKIELSRIPNFRYRYRGNSPRLSVILDNLSIGTIGDNEKQIIQTTPGSHIIFVRNLLNRTEKIEFHVSEDSYAKFECGALSFGEVYPWHWWLTIPVLILALFLQLNALVRVIFSIGLCILLVLTIKCMRPGVSLYIRQII